MSKQKLNKRGAAAIMLLTSIVRLSINKTMGKDLNVVEDKTDLDKAICSEVVTTLNKKDN